MECHHCRFDNPSSMRFCVECGVQLVLQCPRCQAEMRTAYKFCGTCGAALTDAVQEPIPQTALRRTAPSRTAPSRKAPPAASEAVSPPTTAARDGERKQATVLVCELITSAGPVPLDPDALHDVLQRFFELAQSEVERYGGTISRFLDQGFMALFGAPIAHEDHAHRAVLAALGIARRSAAETDGGTRRQVRMGLDTGAVVVGGAGATAVGEATAVATRLQQHARPGAILVSGATADQVRSRVELEEATPLPDGERTIEAWQVLGGTTSWTVQEEELTPFVGRERELMVLTELREQANRGQGQVVGLAGEAGAGKSRLAHEFFRRTFPGSKVSYLRGRSVSYGAAVPYLPLADMIRKGSRISASDSPAEVTAKMRVSLERVGTDPGEALPYFLRLLGIREGTAELDDLEPQALQQRTFAAMRRMILDASRQALVVLELEDVHWIDETSEEFLNSLVEVMGAARVMLVLTYRPGYQPHWLEKSYATQITLQRLSDDESRQLLGSILERSERGGALSDEVVAKAEGNPLFLEELARSVADQDTDDGGAAIPNTIQGILMARIDRLPEEHKHLLRTASVLGRELSLDLLQALWERPEPLEPLLDDLRRWELILKTPSEEETVHFFKHALTQEVAYESLLTKRRRELHKRAAETLEELYRDHLEDAFDRLIYHYPRAGEPEKTVHYLTLHAAHAARAYAHAEAAKALREALAQAEHLPEDERDRRSVELLLKLAESLLPLASFPETLELCERYGERVAGLAEPSLSAQVHFWLAHTHTYLGNQEETRHHAKLAIEAAQECGDETTEGKASYVLGRDGFWSGQFAEGIRASLRAVVLLERSGEPWWQGQAYWVAGFNHYVLGDFAKGIEALERAYAIGEALDDYRLDTSWSLGYFYASLGEWETGIEMCQRGLERSRDPLNTAVATGFLGYAYHAQGDVERAVGTLTDSVERLRQTGMLQILGWFLAFLAEASLADGRSDDARRFAEEGLETTRAAQFHYGTGLAQRAAGRVALADGRLDDAALALAAARDTFTSLEVPLEVGRTRLTLARLAHARGDDATAAEEIAGAKEVFVQLDTAHYEDRATALAEELGISG